ncbi:hypothetical protein FRC08_014938 [Ceratobasidium sp. 394]|nr:hypothetical protein FRC08_014938 [Ceratobasidium sp. 394]
MYLVVTAAGHDRAAETSTVAPVPRPAALFVSTALAANSAAPARILAAAWARASRAGELGVALSECSDVYFVVLLEATKDGADVQGRTSTGTGSARAKEETARIDSKRLKQV